MGRKFIQHNFMDLSNFILLDELLVEESSNLTKVFYPLEKYEKNPVIRTEHLWEGYLKDFDTGYVHDPFYSGILYNVEENVYYCWYQVYGRFGSYLCLAKSSDGLHWEKPELNQVFFEGSFKNNIIKFPKYPATSIDFGGVVPDYLETGAEIVCSNFSGFDDSLYFQGITIGTSENGLDWNLHFPPVLPYDGDANCIMWDPLEKCYLITTRSYQQFNIYRSTGKKRKRHIAISKSKDLIHWTPMVTILEPDEKDPEIREFYKMYILPYAHGYIGFLQIFDVDVSQSKGPCEVQLVFSRDLIRWQRCGDRKAFVQRGNKDEWDAGMNLISTSPVFENQDTIRFWYGGKKAEHWQASTGGIGTGTLRRDGFLSFRTDKEGYLKTVPLMLNGIPELFLNLNANHGEIRVEIIDAEKNEVIAGCEKENCIPVTGDGTRVPVIFKNFPNRLSRPVKIKFYLKNAELFSFKGNLSLPERYLYPRKFPNWW